MHTSEHTGNLSGTERTWSAAIASAMALLALRRGSPLLRSAAAVGGLALLARAVAGHCGVKAAITGHSSIGEGLQEQWRRMSGRQSPGREGESFGTRTGVDAQESVEELGEPTTIEEGLPATESSGAVGSAARH